jgi:AcrR family transcriptional regulator
VHDAVRTLTSEDAPYGVAEVAQRSGVHPTTIYRRWRNLEALLLEVAAEDLARSAPLQPTGDLRADLTRWGRSLAAEVARPGGLAFLHAIARAGAQPGTEAAAVEQLLAPRLSQVAAVIEAAGAHPLTTRDVLEMLVAPVFLGALVGLPLDARDGVDRLVDNVIAVWGHRAGGAPTSR